MQATLLRLVVILFFAFAALSVTAEQEYGLVKVAKVTPIYDGEIHTIKVD